jgi:hypothetical protein
VVRSDDFIGESGVTVFWGKLGRTIIGSIVLAVWSMMSLAWLEVGRAVSDLLEGPQEFGVEVVQLLVDTPAAIVEGSYTELISAAGGAGIAGFAFSVIVVVVLLWIVAKGGGALG